RHGCGRAGDGLLLGRAETAGPRAAYSRSCRAVGRRSAGAARAAIPALTLLVPPRSPEPHRNATGLPHRGRESLARLVVCAHRVHRRPARRRRVAARGVVLGLAPRDFRTFGRWTAAQG